MSSANEFCAFCIVVELNLALVDNEGRWIDICIGRVGDSKVVSFGHFVFLLVLRLCLIVHWSLLRQDVLVAPEHGQLVGIQSTSLRYHQLLLAVQIGSAGLHYIPNVLV